METLKFLTLVQPVITERDEVDCLHRLSSDFKDLHINRLRTIQTLFPLLSSPGQVIDFVCISVDSLCKDGSADVFDIIKTLATLIKCTVQRTGGGKPVKRSTKIFAIISDTTDPEIIKDLSKMEDVYFTFQVGGAFTYTDLHQSISNILAGDFSTPKKIIHLAKQKKKIVNIHESTEVSLTTRQKQIYNLVVERGSSNKVIAKTLAIAESTVKLHMGAILKKYGAKNRTQLVAFSKK
jgi:DNA-binding CsgD family transcriptional regulator